MSGKNPSISQKNLTYMNFWFSDNVKLLREATVGYSQHSQRELGNF